MHRRAMSYRFTKSATAAQQHQSLRAQVQEVDFELGILQKFLTAAPKLREESRYLIPPPEEMTPPLPEAPNRRDLKRVRRQGYYYGIKLVMLLCLFFGASLWFVDRLLAVMR